MLLSRSKSGERGRPVLLGLVLGVVLVLVGITASALVAITSVRLTSATLNGVVSRDASLVALFLNGTLRTSDLDLDGPSAARAGTLTRLLGTLSARDSIVRIEIRELDGAIIVSDQDGASGQATPDSAAMRDARNGDPTATLEEAGAPLAAGGELANPSGMVQEFLPIMSGDEPIAVVAMWRDAGELMTSLEATRREIMLVTLMAGALLAAMLFVVFRSAQARLTRQHRQILDATRRDALTGMLNHGAAVGLLADRLEAARDAGEQIGVGILDIDNFRGFNDTHGHDAGDEVLLRVAELVRTEGDGHSVARYGPDEFLLFAAGSGVREMEQIVDRLRHHLDEVTVQFGDSERLPVSVSAGIAVYPEHAEALTELLSAATVALGEAKASGGDRVRVARSGAEKRVLSGSFDVLQGLVIAVDTKDRYTKRHSEDVARYAAFLAERMGFDEEVQRTARLAGLLHDLGKIGIPDVVLRKPSRLTDDEHRMFQQHVVLGEALVRDVPNVELVRAGIRHHHERWDGLGYPDGLSGQEIPLVARILSVADTFSAMTTTRPYRKALPLREALTRLREAAGGQLQPDLVEAFIEGIETAADAPLPGEDPAGLWVPDTWVA